MTEREKAEDVLPNLLDEKQHFFRYITTGMQKMRKLEKHFSRHRKQDKTRKHVKHLQQTKGTDKIVFFGDKTEKGSLTEVYKDSKIVKKGYTWRKRRDNPRARTIKKNEMAKKAKNKHGERKKENKWIEDEQKGGNKEAKQTFKQGNVELEKEHTVSLSLSLSKKRQQKRKLFRKTWFFFK